ncbi:MAG: putative transport system ATP-binding protein [Thermotogota bacterium]|nr:putative transport system ATP-binding protein [Thermotogota bacterium]MDK2864979.1 putative transport system ATP-binding protein [Thermotogota bacterium]
MIRLENVTRIYRMGTEEVRALDGVTLEVQPGEILVVMGPSGSGKSTLLHIMGCLDRPTSGQVYIDGRNVSKLNDRQLARVRNAMLGFVFQQFNLLPRLTALENVELPMIYAGVPRKKRIDRARDLLERFELSDRLKHRPSQLSGGQQQRVAIARALANNPKVILADEPTGNLDTASGEVVIENLVRLNREEGITVVVVTHDPEIAGIGDRVIHMRDGRIIREEVRG